MVPAWCFSRSRRRRLLLHLKPMEVSARSARTPHRQKEQHRQLPQSTSSVTLRAQYHCILQQLLLHLVRLLGTLSSEGMPHSSYPARRVQRADLMTQRTKLLCRAARPVWSVDSLKQKWPIRHDLFFSASWMHAVDMFLRATWGWLNVQSLAVEWCVLRCPSTTNVCCRCL